jgi:hypothetical protein
VEVERKDWQMFCRKSTEQVEFRRSEGEGMPDSNVGSTKP